MIYWYYYYRFIHKWGSIIREFLRINIQPFLLSYFESLSRVSQFNICRAFDASPTNGISQKGGKILGQLLHNPGNLTLKP